MRLANSTGDMKPRYDAVIIGSGYGGGVSASRLARCGFSVCVLEAGREFTTGSFPDRFPEMRRELQVTSAKHKTGSDTALYDFRAGRDIHVLAGRGLGGGSLINAGVAFRPDARVFTQAAWPRELLQDGSLYLGYERAGRMLAPNICPDASSFTKYKALDKAADAQNARARHTPTVISFEDRVNHANVHQSACTQCGDCCSGCNVGAKNTVALTYLPDASHHGAEIFTEVKASHLTKTDDGWQVHFRAQADKSGTAHTQCVGADIVVVAGGALGSTEILLRSRDQGLALSDQLGRGFSANGDIIAFGYDTDEPINGIGAGFPAKVDIPPVGPSVAGHIEIRDPDNLDRGMIIEEGVLPSALAPLLPVLFVPGGRILGALSSLIKGVYQGPLSRTQTFFVVSHDDGNGRMELENDRLAIHWPDVHEQAVFKRVDEALKKTVQAIGGSYVKNPLSGSMLGATPATAHPLGGCRMGRSGETGVVDHKCRVFDSSGSIHKGLYVCDGAIMPRSLGVNPLLTITALTERAMIHLSRDFGRSFDDAPPAPHHRAA